MKTLFALMLTIAHWAAFGQNSPTEPSQAQEAPLKKIKHRKHLFSISPMILWLPIKYEFMPTRHHGVGLQVKIFPDFFGLPSGVNFQPYYRYYVGGKVLNGPFVQLKAAYGHYKNNNNFISKDEFCYHYGIDDYSCPSVIKQFHSVGGGLAGGYQVLIGKKKRGVAEGYAGFSYHIPLNVTDKDGKDVTPIFNLGEFGFFDFGVRIGAAF